MDQVSLVLQAHRSVSVPMVWPTVTVDVLYLAWNRLEFTKVSFNTLAANTDWSLVDRLVVYDDGSKDGTAEWLESQVASAQSFDAPVEFRRTKFGSPVDVMVDYLTTMRDYQKSAADVFAKIDNDIAVPLDWLSPALDVMARDEGLDLLGLAAGWTGLTTPGYMPSSHIGGVGLMRRAAFERHPDLWGAGRQGFTQWQHAHPDIVRGWITPDLPVVQLDLIPDEPWRTLADHYVGRGWARAWPPYDESSRDWWSWVPVPEGVTA